MNPSAVRMLIAEVTASFAEFGIAVNHSREATVSAGACYALASFPLEANLPDGVLVHWVSAHCLPVDAQRDRQQQLNEAATAILNHALDHLLAELGYSTRPAGGGAILVTGWRHR